LRFLNNTQRRRGPGCTNLLMLFWRGWFYPRPRFRCPRSGPPMPPGAGQLTSRSPWAARSWFRVERTLATR